MDKLKLWKSYKYRFIPWIIFNLKNRKIRRVNQHTNDKIIEDEKVLLQIQFLVKRLLQHIPHEQNAPINHRKEMHETALQQMENIFGYHVKRGVSKVGGDGVFVRSSEPSSNSRVLVQKGQVVGLYPGLLYLPYQPILIQSINNQFVFRCIDGVHIDGNDRRLSKYMYKSCVGRDKIGFDRIADESWLTDMPLNPLNIGQYVNNQTKEYESNVAYQELIVPVGSFPLRARRFLPNLWYSKPRDVPVEAVPLRLVSLVATKDIIIDEELFSDYYTVVS